MPAFSANPDSSAGPQPGAERKVAALGLTLALLDEALRQRFDLPEDAKGVVVVGVDEGGPAAEKGIRAGDLVVEVSQEDASSQVGAPADRGAGPPALRSGSH